MSERDWSARCEVCGDPFGRLRRGHRFCSLECWERQRPKRVDRRARLYQWQGPRACVACGKQFEPRHPVRRYCSRQCQMGQYRAQRASRYTRQAVCDQCGQVFIARDKATRFCRPECRKAWWLDRKREQRRRG